MVWFANANSTIQRTQYYPGGLPWAEGTGANEQNRKYNGKEFIEMHGYDTYDFHARMYMPALARTTTMDPMAENYYSQSPYSFMGNNPILNIDPTGMWYNPIYDYGGNFLGTDDLGLRGEAIIMYKEKFKQGMSHKDAMDIGRTLDNMNDEQAMEFANNGNFENFLNHYNSLSSRPDWDGYITLSEANDWYKNGGGQSLFTDLSKLDLSRVYSLGEDYVKQDKTVNLLLNSNSLNDGLVYGQVKLKRYPNHQVRAYADKYDFDMHNAKNPLNWPRNVETLIGRKVAGQGQKYEINLYGSKQLKPLFPWIK